MNQLTIPLFPLNSILFPGGPLPLRIFEPRYLSMVSRCMREQSGFGICLISEGNEVGQGAKTYNVGTLSKIQDWNQGSDGLLEITAVGEQRFRILSRSVVDAGLIMADVELLQEEPEEKVPASMNMLQKILKDMIEQVGPLYGQLTSHYDDATWLGARLTELLPISLESKQELLQMERPQARLELLLQHINDSP